MGFATIDEKVNPRGNQPLPGLSGGRSAAGRRGEHGCLEEDRLSAERCCMIIDGHPMTRLGIRHALRDSWEFEELSDGRGAIELLNSVGRIEVAVVEMRAPTRGIPSGPTTIRRILRAEPALGIVAYGGRVERHAVNEAREAGAGAYVSKRSSPTTLERAIESVLATKPFIDPAADVGSPASKITPRQRQILQHFANGMPADAVAEHLGLSRQTVSTHAKQALRRLGAKDRPHAIAIALRDALID